MDAVAVMLGLGQRHCLVHSPHDHAGLWLAYWLRDLPGHACWALTAVLISLHKACTLLNVQDDNPKHLLDLAASVLQECFTLQAKLGEGGNGMVFSALHTGPAQPERGLQHGEQYVLKVLLVSIPPHT